MAAASLGFPPRQGDVDLPHLKNGEGFADRVHAIDALEQCSQAGCRYAVDLEVDVLRVAAEPPIAHPAADDQRTPPASRTARAISELVEFAHGKSSGIRDSIWIHVTRVPNSECSRVPNPESHIPRTCYAKPVVRVSKSGV